MRAEKQRVVRNNPKGVHRDTTMSFAAMDQEVRGETSDCSLICLFIQFVVDSAVLSAWYRRLLYCRQRRHRGPEWTKAFFLREG